MTTPAPQPQDNKWLLLRPGVKLTEHISPKIVALDSFFEAAGFIAWVTSGFRSAQDQLETIRYYAIKEGVSKEFPEVLTCLLTERENFEGQLIYRWQKAWSRLLEVGVIINPPTSAVCLFDYIGDDGVSRKGRAFPPTSHLYGGSFDIGGNTDGIEGNTTNELAVIRAAFETKAVPGLKRYKIERKNNCIHIDVEREPLGKESP